MKLGRLKRTLADLTTAKENPSGTLRRVHPATNSVHLYDNVSDPNTDNDPNANTNATNRLLSSLMKDYHDADLSRSQDLPVVPNHLVHPAPPPAPGPVRVPTDRPYQSLGRLPARTAPPDARHRGNPPFDDYVLFSPLDHSANHRVAQVRTMPRTERLNEHLVNQSWNKMVTAADLVNGQDYIDLISFMDDTHSDEVQNSSAELDNGSQVSIGQLSTVASSGYQSFGYSQSSSPVESAVTAESGSGGTSGGQPLSFANPLFAHQNTPQSSRSRTGDLPRVMSSSSLSSEDGTLSPHSRRAPPPTQNGAPPHHYQNHTQTEALPRKLSNLSCSSSSSESLAERRAGRGAPSSGGRRTYSQLSHSHSLDSRCTTAAASHDMLPTEPAPLTLAQLSRSAELPQFAPAASPQQQRMRRTHTADAILSPAPASRGQQHCAYGRRAAGPHNTVRMGVRCVQQQQRQQADQENTQADVSWGPVLSSSAIQENRLPMINITYFPYSVVYQGTN